MGFGTIFLRKANLVKITIINRIAGANWPPVCCVGGFDPQPR